MSDIDIVSVERGYILVMDVDGNNCLKEEEE